MVPVRSLLVLLAVPACAFRVKPKKKAERSKANSSATAYVVTLGDSYASGTGIHNKISDYHEGDECCREFATTQGGRVAASQGKQHLMPACAGHEIPGIKRQFNELQAAHPAEVAAGWEGSTFMSTIGGNDIRSHGGEGWSGILVNCILSFYGDCHRQHENQVANFAEVRAELVDFYSTMATGASKAAVRVFGYPRLLQRTWFGCLPVPGVSSGASDWADGMVDELNTYLRSVVDEVKGNHAGFDIQFVDVTNRMDRGACSMLPGKHVHAIVLNFESLLSPMTFHPSQAGYNQYYNAVSGTVGLSEQQTDAAAEQEGLWFPERIFSGWDTAGKGKLSLSDVHRMAGDDANEEILAIFGALFREADHDKDGFLVLEEFKGFLSLAEKAERGGA